jgi:hypothetical protein
LREQAVAERDRYRDALEAIAEREVINQLETDEPITSPVLGREQANAAARAALAVSTP